MGFWSAKLLLRLSWRRLGQYRNVPWLLHCTELVHLFGGVGGCGCNVPLLGLASLHGVLYDYDLHFFTNKSQHIFMHMLLLQLDCSGCLNDICCLTYNLYMNWFVCNYMNLVVNVLHMLLMLSPSVLTTLPDIRQTFLMNLAISTVTLVSDWSVSAVCVILPCCCDYRIWVDCSARSCACPLCGVFLAELGLIPFNLELIFTFLSLRSVGTSRTHSLTLCISDTLATDRVILLAFVRHRGQGIMLILGMFYA